ncbi:iron transporter [Bartonella sp. TP]|uniref:iron transporter n=1 Tax=Bartonella sp. TP TaxID=3057550 RepID=UPI0025B25EAC|nr:iron transporter [Bartonella sp. TP]MDN5249313.1 iron transporter [Alphaproteobacteria bacterium]WJW79738.1 iron transporter [Bartonella sp. TP]
MLKKHNLVLYASISLASFICLPYGANAGETPIGKPQMCGGMEIGAVYLQPIEMMPKGMMTPVEKSDVHLEADIHAVEHNKNGFPEGWWIPYLGIDYELKKDGLAEAKKGPLMAMVANDGPHYGDNIKLMGPGKYHLTLTILPPDHKGEFGRHIDKETGVAPFFNKCVTHYDFVYAGTGKKGGY